MKCSLLYTIFIVTGSLLCTGAYAGSQSGTVKHVHVRDRDGLIFFYLDGVANSRAECGTNTYWIIRDENSEAGKRQYALLLGARASGAIVHVFGSGKCTRWVDGEDVDTLGW